MADAIDEADKLFGDVETACDAVHDKSPRRQRDWNELRIREAELVDDTVSLPLQRVRESLGDLIEASEDEESTAELIECNRRIGEIREAVSTFIGQSAEKHVYWVERTGRQGQSLALNASPIDTAEFLRQHLLAAVCRWFAPAPRCPLLIPSAAICRPNKRRCVPVWNIS